MRNIRKGSFMVPKHLQQLVQEEVNSIQRLSGKEVTNIRVITNNPIMVMIVLVGVKLLQHHGPSIEIIQAMLDNSFGPVRIILVNQHHGTIKIVHQ